MVFVFSSFSLLVSQFLSLLVLKACSHSAQPIPYLHIRTAFSIMLCNELKETSLFYLIRT